MITLSTTQKIQAVLAGAVTTNQLQVDANFGDKTSSAYTPGASRVSTNSTTAVDVVAAPSSGTRDVNCLIVQNRDTVAATITFQIDTSGTPTRLFKVALAVNDTLIYTHGSGLEVIDANGNLKQSTTLPNYLLAANNLSDLVSAAAARANLGLAIGSDVQAYDADLASWAAITRGTGFDTAAAINVGSAGAFVTNGGALGTPSGGTLTNCTFPTLNQNTTGSAAKWTTPRTIGGASIDGSAAVSYDSLLGVTSANNRVYGFSGSATPSLYVTASANTASALVQRDGSGNFSAGTITAALSGNATTATGLATGRTLAITGDLSWTSPSFDGTGNVTAAGTLATVNANTGSFGSATAAPTFTVNGKGLLTAAGTVTITPAVGSITGFGTGVGAALVINVGSAGAPVLFNGAGGTPSSIVLTNGTGLPIGGGLSGLGAANRIPYATSATAMTTNSGFTFDGSTFTTTTTSLLKSIASSTSGTGLTLQNSSSSSAGNPCYSPRIILKGNAWSTGDSAAETVEIGEENITADGASPSGLLRWSYQINGAGGFTGLMELTTGGLLQPVTNDGISLGASGRAFSDLFLASGAVINFAASNVVVTHSSGILTLGTGDLRITTAGTNSASVVTVGGTQTLTNKTLTAAALGSSTATTQSPGDNSTKLATTAYVDAIPPTQATKHAQDFTRTGGTIGSDWNHYATDKYYGANGAQNDEYKTTVVVAPGNYDVVLAIASAGNSGIYTVKLDGASLGTVDGYSASPGNIDLKISNVAFSAGPHTLSFTMATKNASATGYYPVLSHIHLDKNGGY